MIQSFYHESRLDGGHEELVRPYCQSYARLARLEFICESHEKLFFSIHTYFDQRLSELSLANRIGFLLFYQG